MLGLNVLFCLHSLLCVHVAPSTYFTYAGGDVPVGIYLESERISSMVPKAFEEKYIRLYSRFVNFSGTEHESELTEEDSKLVKSVIRSAFFAWAKQEENDACLVEPPTPARVSSLGSRSQRVSGARHLRQHWLSPTIEERQPSPGCEIAKRERQTPGKQGLHSVRATDYTSDTEKGGAKKKLKLK